MYPSRPNQTLAVAAALVLLMAATRFHHFGSAVNLPDASLAVFFLAGFYLRGKLMFPLLLTEAGLIDYLAITQFGVSDWCVTPAYVFLIPTYAAPWMAGLWFRHKAAFNWRALLPLVGSLFAGASIAFALSNGSFYLFSDYFSGLSSGEYVERVMTYSLPYLSSPFIYVALAACVHGIVHALKSSRRAAVRPSHD